MYTIKRVCDLAGTTPRTLRHYDAVGLLRPALVGGNGYRYYDDGNLLALQQILLYREWGLPLDRIGKLMSRPDYSVLEALESHRTELRRRIERLERVTLTVDETIERLKEGRKMEGKELFRRLSAKEEEAYAGEAARRWDPKIVSESQRRFKAYSDDEKKAIFAEGNAIYAELAAAMPSGADSERTQALIERWRKNMEHFWTPPLEALPGLADLYNDDPRFRANFDRIDPALAPFMREAVSVYAARKSRRTEGQ